MRRAAAPALLVALATTTACGDSSKAASGLEFKETGAPFTFSYPDGLTRQLGPVGREFQGRMPRYRVAIGSDETNVVVVAQYRLRGAKPVEQYDPKAFGAYVDDAARTLAGAAETRVKGRSRGRLGGLPSWSYELTTTPAGRGTRLIFAFRGHIQYFVRCQWDDAGRSEIAAACAEVQRTFRPSS